ncbi:hypothetical protein FXB41_00020 [Bradyrhizobium canariense]|uniref:ribonuclease E/G n=1 Tax=Bradyrhizobium canariense TaxID=255045 RepID=UPI001CA5308C|nr:ribonuclease E/G [Bradyrhizobium canariense]MBW5433225.1 hypothetical protein [Bradyrhizobium canariense]
MADLNVNDKLFPPEEPLEGLEGDALVEAVKAWFLSNFEDPAESTPYDSGEGGYQWIWGGPYDAREEIEGYFNDEIPAEIVDQVVAELESTALEWAPSNSRIYEEEDGELPDEPVVSDGPELPQQGYGPHFEIDEDGVVTLAPPAALDARGNNVDRLKRMLPSLRELSSGLVEQLNKGNSPHHHLLARASAYRDLVNQEIEQIDFSLLYIAGVRLANAKGAADEDKDLPRLEVPDREAADSLLQIHGSFILASADGLEALAAEERYNRTRQEEEEYRAAAVEFAEQLQNQPDIIHPDAASAVLDSVQEIGKGSNIERSGTVASGILLNATITISIAASLGAVSAQVMTTQSLPLIAVMGAAALVATEGLKKSKPFTALAALVTKGIDTASTADIASVTAAVRKRFSRHLKFFRNAGPQLKRLSVANDQSFRWLAKTLRWIETESELQPPKDDFAEPAPIQQAIPPGLDRIGIEGNIYLAKVSKVEQALNAAFVDYGAQRDGFLSFSEIHPDYFQIPPEEKHGLYRQQQSDQKDLDTRANSGGVNEAELREARADVARLRPYIRDYKLSDVIKRRQVLIVQVLKEGSRDQGARLTTYLSIPGRYTILLPNTALGGAASNQMDTNERIRLLEIVRHIEVPEGMGVILRSSSAFRTEHDIREDLGSLVRIWESLRELVLKSAAPALVYDPDNPPINH